MPKPDRKRAVALEYGGTGAPKVTAAGQGLIAERIVKLAEENGVPIRHDPALVSALETLKIGHEIPDALYMAVAELLAWAYALDGEAGEARKARGRL